LPRSSTQNRFVEKNKLISLPRIQKTQHKLSIGGMRAPNFGLQCAFAASKIGGGKLFIYHLSVAEDVFT
jgi:hypothetical protein